MTEKATEYARQISENGLVFVYLREGVYWLALRSVDSAEAFRTLRAVGTTKTGIRYIRQEISSYFSEK